MNPLTFNGRRWNHLGVNSNTCKVDFSYMCVSATHFICSKTRMWHDDPSPNERTTQPYTGDGHSMALPSLASSRRSVTRRWRTSDRVPANAGFKTTAPVNSEFITAHPATARTRQARALAKLINDTRGDRAALARDTSPRYDRPSTRCRGRRHSHF